MRKLFKDGPLMVIFLATGCVDIFAYPPIAACTPHHEDRLALAVSSLGTSELDRAFRDCPSDGLEKLRRVLEESNERKRQELLVKAGNGDAEAQHHLAMLYLPSRQADIWSSPKARSEALKWLCRSARQGYAPAEYEVAQLYRSGPPSISRDYVNAYLFYSRAASHGDTRAPLERDRLAKLMSSQQIVEAQRLVLEQQPSPRDCEGDSISVSQM